MSQPPSGEFTSPEDPSEPDARAPSPGDAETGPQSIPPPPPSAYPPPGSGPSGPPQGYPPPGYRAGDQGGYPPPPAGPPPGYYQQGQPPSGPPAGYQGGYQPGPPAGPPQQGSPPQQGGYPQQGTQPGYQPPQGPQPGYQPPQGPQPGYPPQGYNPPPPGYGPPGGPPPGYGPPGAPQGYPPPQGAYPQPGAPGGRAAPSFDVSNVSIAGWGVIGAAALTLIASFFPFWSVSYTGISLTSVGLNGWSLWWWIPVLLAIAVGVVYALQVFGVIKPGQVKSEWLVYGAAASFVLMIVVLVQTFIYAGGYSSELGDIGIKFGPSIGVWFALITTLALTYFTALAAQNSGTKLPFKVPGPA